MNKKPNEAHTKRLLRYAKGTIDIDPANDADLELYAKLMKLGRTAGSRVKMIDETTFFIVK